MPKQLEEGDWFEKALTALRDSGPTGRASADYIERRRIRLGFSPQRTGASWFDWRRLRFGLFLNADYADRRPDDPWLYGLLAHEAKHLEQGLMEALSVRGELVAWQTQYDVLTESSAEPRGHAWRRLRTLDARTRADLASARVLMKQIAGPGYSIDWLPLWSLREEVAYRLGPLRRLLLRPLRPKREEKHPAEGSWADTPITDADDDRFGFRDYAHVLTHQMAKLEPPVTIGIFGDWGSGKTSLMRLMQGELRRRVGRDTPVPKFLWINVWQLSNQEELWNAFLQTLLTQVHKKLPPFRRLAFDWRLLHDRVDYGALARQLLANVYRIFVVVTPLLLVLLWPAPRPADASQLLAVALDPWTGGGASLLLGLWLLLKPAVEAAREKMSLDLGAVLKEAPYEAQVSALQQLQGQFERMVKAWVGRKGKGRLVIFIDDLDRCLPDKVPEVLEALKLFTTTRRCVYVLGLDHEAVCRGIAMKYRSNQDEGSDYLEKIVQIPFHLPPLEDDRIEAFVRKDYRKVCKDCPTVPRVLSLGLEPNPRKVKRALNIYRTLLDLAGERVDAWEMIGPVEPELVAKMVVIQSRFRRLYEYLVKHPPFLRQVEAKALPEEERADLVKLYPDLLGGDDQDVDRILVRSETEETEAEPALIEETDLPALNAMLCAGEKRFSAADQRNQTSSYIYLTGTAEGAVEGVRPSREERDALLGGDREEIEKQVREINERGADEQAQKNIKSFYVKRLERVLKDLDRRLPAQCVSANTALDLLEGWTRREQFEPETVRIPAGPFPTGPPGAEGTEVDMVDYRIGRYPVTNAEYQAFVRATNHRPPEYWSGGYHPAEKGDHPVMHVSWDDAEAYCEWLCEKTGRPYRLPHEDEWEKAARGMDRRKYPWGDELPDKSRCNCGGWGKRTTPVGQYSPKGDSPYGCADMAGNVAEWTEGRVGETTRLGHPRELKGVWEGVEEKGPPVVRGGGFTSRPQDVVCYDRQTSPPDPCEDLGFRVALFPPSEVSR